MVWLGFALIMSGWALRSEAVGGYSNGCLVEGVVVPEKGPGFQLVRVFRERHYAHPKAALFLGELGGKLVSAGIPRVLVGDISQRLGGRMPSGHKSHQIGLDIDIWFTHPDPVRGELSRERGDAIEFDSLVDTAREKVIEKRWKPEHTEMLKLAATTPGIARIFVNYAIKGHLCDTVKEDRAWLRLIRPWWAHTSHFHVRLSCAEEDAECRDQDPLPEGDGCQSVEWFTRAAVQKRKREGVKAEHAAHRPLPERCEALLLEKREPGKRKR